MVPVPAGISPPPTRLPRALRLRQSQLRINVLCFLVNLRQYIDGAARRNVSQRHLSAIHRKRADVDYSLDNQIMFHQQI
jgi:hypothetical protein